MTYSHDVLEQEHPKIIVRGKNSEVRIYTITTEIHDEYYVTLATQSGSTWMVQRHILPQNLHENRDDIIPQDDTKQEVMHLLSIARGVCPPDTYQQNTSVRRR